MVFSSLIFIFLFLPVQLLAYYIVPKKWKNAILLIFSLLFYAWAGPVYLLILTGEAAISWYFALRIEKSDGSQKKWLVAAVTILIAVLIVFKYLAFAANTINVLLGIVGLPSVLVPAIALPIGISFYTFQLISYLADVYKREVSANKHYAQLLLYCSLFHQCIAGPIVRYETVNSEIEHREVSLDEFYAGIWRFSIGLAKKAVLANSVAKLVDDICGDGISTLASQSVGALWLMALCYTLQIYLDFSAYSDMALGMGQMVGFHYLENFNYPYISTSVKEFWRRWHMSLSSFFRDYVYIPLGGSRVGKVRYIFNLFVVWALTGLWHGASMNFVLWGLYYFVWLIIEKFVFKDKQIKGLGNIYTLFVVVIGWVIFKFDNISELTLVLKAMFGLGTGEVWNLAATTMIKSNMFLLIVCAIACTPLFKIGMERLKNSEKKQSVVAVSVIEVVLPPLLVVLSTLALVGNSYNPFLYFRF